MALGKDVDIYCFGYCFGYWIVRGKLDNASDFGMIIWDIE